MTKRSDNSVECAKDFMSVCMRYDRQLGIDTMYAVLASIYCNGDLAQAIEKSRSGQVALEIAITDTYIKRGRS